jgi:hypothetical protein
VTVSSWLWAGSFVAAQPFFVAPDGDDAGPCVQDRPCATFQHAFDVCPTGGQCAILAAPGLYRQLTNIYYYKAIHIQGQLDDRGHCIDRGKVIVEGGNTKGRGALFWVQDHAILIMTCLTLRGGVPGMIGMAARQFAIGDAFDTDFGDFPGGFAVTANETSKISVLYPGIRGTGIGFASAGDLSQVTIGGPIKMAADLKYDTAFVGSIGGAVVSVSGPFEGGERMKGASYHCDGGVIKKTIILPGGDKPYEPENPCILNGPGFENAPKQTVARWQINQVNAQLGELRESIADVKDHTKHWAEDEGRRADDLRRLRDTEERLERVAISIRDAVAGRQAQAQERQQEILDALSDMSTAITREHSETASSAAAVRDELKQVIHKAVSEQAADLRHDLDERDDELRHRLRRDRTRMALGGAGAALLLLLLVSFGIYRVRAALRSTRSR